ncbi:MAG: DNA gyrase C-terminal beta-propeller domain-containing protein, partial [Candidatus Cloacimonadaceae bacterium]
GDELIDARISELGDDILLATRNGYCNRFSEKDIRAMGRVTKGVRGIRLRDEDYVISMTLVSAEQMLENGDGEATILTVSENGFGKRTSISSYTTTKRGSKGVITLKTSTRNGHLASLMMVSDEDELMIITHDGMIIRQTVKEISSIGRNTQGVRLINLTKGDKVHDITRVPPEDADDESLDKEVEELKKAPKLNLKDLVESDVDQKDDFGGEIEDDTDIDDNDDSEDSDD